jgi:hypothetical protein
MKNIKHLEKHFRGRKHREVLESTQMNERRRGYNRCNPRRHGSLAEETGGTQQRPPRTIKHPGEECTFHLNNRVNSYSGPGPDCSSQNYDQEPPDGPSEIGLYDAYIDPTPYRINSMPIPMHVRNGDAPRVTDVTPNRGMVDPTPSTEELVRRLGEGWEVLQQARNERQRVDITSQVQTNFSVA